MSIDIPIVHTDGLPPVAVTADPAERQATALESIASSLSILAGLAMNVDSSLRELGEAEPSKAPSMMAMLPMLLKAAGGR